MITLDGSSLTVDAVERVAAGEPVEIHPAGLERVALAWRTIVAIAAERPLYGRATGVGANRSVAVPAADQAAHGRRLLASHATVVGPTLSPALVRAAIAVRINKLAAGGAGIRPDTVGALVALLDAPTAPAVRDGGSLGTGDLAALAQIGLALGIELDAGDAVALMSSNALTLARAGRATVALQRLGRAGLVVAALTMRAVDGNTEALSEAVTAARPHPGQAQAAAVLRSLLSPVAPWAAARVQDSYGVRAMAQVAGPLLDAGTRLARTLAIDLNAAAENPMVDTGTGRVLHHGNFHLAALAVDLDAARLALYQAAALSAARLTELMEPDTTGLAAFLAADTPGSSGALGLEYVAHASLAHLRQAAQPTTLAGATLSRGTEDHAPFAPEGARQLDIAIDAAREVLACEFVAAVRALRQKSVALAGPLAQAMAAAAVIDADMHDRDLTPDLDRAAHLLDVLDAMISDPPAA